MFNFSWRKALVAPVVLALGIGGALFASTAANAADAGLTVTSPVNGSTVASRTVTVTGSVYGGSTVIVYDADGSNVLARSNVGGDFGEPTPYSLDLPVYSDSAPSAETIKVGGLYGGSGIPQQTVNFNLPEAAATFSVTSPTEGQAEASRTVTFTGTGTNGSTVNVLGTDGNRVPGTSAAVVSNGTWSTTGTYADDAAVAQTVDVNQVTGGSGDGEATVHFTLPGSFNFTVTSPTEGQAEASRAVTFTGTGTDGSTVNVLDTNGNRVPGTTAAVVSNGTWSTTGTYADDAAVAQTVNVNQVTGGAGRGNVTVHFTLPASFNFTVTSPIEGQAEASRTVTFTGTGTDGSTVNVLDTDGNRVPGTTAAVVSNGTWSTTGTYADDAAVAQTVNVNQVTGGAGRGNVTVHFTLPAGTTPTPPANGGSTGTPAPVSSHNTGNGSGTDALAETGSDVVGWGAIAGLLLAAGAATTVVLSMRRRSARQN